LANHPTVALSKEILIQKEKKKKEKRKTKRRYMLKVMIGVKAAFCPGGTNAALRTDSTVVPLTVAA
jgi:hypothetical protein